ncbi:MAG: hypothetical protein NTY38_09315 [Acidobacteria bacterium]|nr:hypothetical protein [Acidobacteriota bacterium]
MKAAALLLLAALGALAQTPRLVFTKAFPNSQPAFLSIALERDGAAVYNDDPKEDNPIRFQIAKEDAELMFGLAGKLDSFKRPLEAGLKVAFMGTKTFRWENGAEKSEVKFNYTQDEDARILLDWFERISETELRFIDLERAIRFDKLGVNKSLIELQVVFERKRLMAPGQFGPMLKRIAKNESILHMARERAASLLDAFEKQKALAAAPPTPTQ